MSTAERLMRYCRYDTQSDPDSGTHPSSEKQFVLAKQLVEELKVLGLEDASVDEHCYIYAHLPANTEQKCPTIGFIAHMDTAPDYSGTNVNPRLIEQYDGGDIQLSETMVTRISDFPQLAHFKGKTLIVTDGTTLLGADDKAGIATIMEAMRYYHEHPDVMHGAVSVAFTPDEEIGEGAMFFDPKQMKADYAFTVDGDTITDYSDETFNAASVSVIVKGLSVHPGEAKNKMKNAALIATEYAGLLPDWLTPSHTEGKEGFIHLTSISGDIAEAKLDYILRDHDAAKLESYYHLMEQTAALLNARYGDGTISTAFTKSYRNMKDVLKDHPEVSALAQRAIQAIGYEPRNVPIRGGTDGSNISFMGLPCPNIGNGGGNFHGPYEYCVVEELEDTVRLIRKMVELTLEDAK